MIINTKRGTLLAGFVPNDAETTQVGQYNTDKTTFAVKAYEDAPEQGKRNGNPHWLNVVCWGAIARYASSIQKKDHVLVCGTLQTRQYTNKNGEEKQITELIADYVSIQSDPGESFPPPEDGAFSDFSELDGDDVPF